MIEQFIKWYNGFFAWWVTSWQDYTFRRRAKRHYLRFVEDQRMGIVSLAPPEWGNVVDTSHYSVRTYVNGSYVYAAWDWLKTKLVYLINIAKASQGVYIDSFYDEQIATLTSADALFASYSFFDPTVNAINAARAFCDKVEASGGWGKFVVVDCEVRPSTISPTTYLAYLGSFIHEVENRLAAAGRTIPVVIYSRGSFWNPIWTSAGSPSWTSKYPQWIALYPFTSMSLTDFRALCQNILYNGYVPSPPNQMMGLGPMVGWQWTAHMPNDLIPGHNMVKKVEDSNLFLLSFLSLPETPVPPEPSAGLRFEVLTSTLNIRSGPGTSFSDIGDLHLGDIVTALDVSGGDAWIRISENPEQWVAVRVSPTTYLRRVL